jgi:hypothetical protein
MAWFASRALTPEFSGAGHRVRCNAWLGLNGAKACRDSGLSCWPDLYRCRGDEARRNVCSEWDYATRRAGLPPASADIHGLEGAGATLGASEGDSLLLVALPSRFQCFSAVEVESFTQGDPQSFDEGLFRPFLTVHARHLFDPADSPIAFALQHGGKVVLHRLTSFELLLEP